MFDRTIFATRVKELRKSKKLTQSELGEILSLSVQAVNDIEKGRKITTFDNLFILAEFFEVTSDYLLGLSDIKERR